MSKLGQLDFVFKGQMESDDALIVMHGYGASMHDLAPIGEWLAPQVGGAWYFLQAPLEVALGPYMSGRAWFPIDMMKLQMATAHGDFSRIFEKDLPAGIDEATEKIKTVLDLLTVRHKRVHIAGFSQGSMMAAKVALENQSQVQSLSMLSGVLVSKHLWQEKVQGQLPFPSFQSHGRQDPVLPISEAHKLRDFLTTNNLKHQYVEFSGGHEIPMPVLTAWLQFLQGAMK